MDILKTVGLLLIIMAHIPSVPNSIMYLRSFDVPMMVFLSGMSFQFSYPRYQDSNGNFNYRDYAINRFKRLVVPTWIYMTFLFILMFIASLVLKIEFPYSLKTIISSYSLFHGISYIWIMRVYFISSLLYPIVLIVDLKTKKKSVYILTLIVSFLFIIQYYLVNIFNNPSNIFVRIFFEEIFLQTTGYFIVSLISFIWVQSSKKNKGIFIGALLSLYLIFGYMYEFQMLSMDKYPPGPYYLSYGLLVTMLLLYLPKIEMRSLEILFDYIARNSLEIYFWHTFFVIAISFLKLNYNWIFLYIVVIILSLITTYIQKKFFPKLFILK